MQNSVGMRVKQARKHAKLTQVELAKAVDTSQGAISDLENGRNESSTNLVQMAKVMGVSPTWLATGEGSMIETSTQVQIQNGQSQTQKATLDQLRQQIEDIKNPTYNGLTFQDAELIRLSDDDDTVPIISWVAAGSWSNVEPVSLDDEILGRLPRPRNLSKRGFALIVKGRSMLPEFKPEDIIFVEPETGFLKLKDGDLVVVSCNDDKEATFKQLVIGETSDDMYLKPLNPEWLEQKMHPVGDCNLVGKVVGKYVIY